MKVIELFAGIGATRMALNELKIEHEVIGISEIDSNAINMYNAIHGETVNFGDIKKIEHLPQCNLLHASSPCTSFSNAGKKDGLKGASGLLLDVIRLLKDYKKRSELPEYFSFENVIEMKTKFTNIFNDFIAVLNEMGYNVYENCLNASYFDIPQKRERLFIIGIRKDIDTNNFHMPENINKTNLRLKNILVSPEEIEEEYIHPIERFNNRHKRIRAIPKNTFQTIEDGYYFTETSTKRSQSNRIYNREGLCPTITTVPFINILEDSFVRKAMPIEYWRSMGFKDKDFFKIKDNFSKTALIKATGNSIALGPLKAIYNNLFKSQD